MKDITLSVGSGKLIEHDEAKVFFYLTKDYLVRVNLIKLMVLFGNTLSVSIGTVGMLSRLI